MTPSLRSTPGSVLLQIVIGVSALFSVAALSVLHTETFGLLMGQAAIPEVRRVDIGIEHDEPVALRFLFGTKGSAWYLSLTGDPRHETYVSVPASWKRMSVRGASLEDVRGEEPTFGFRRWSLPAGAGMTMSFSGSITELRFASPSPSVATITVDRVDIVSGDAKRDVVLLQEETQVRW